MQRMEMVYVNDPPRPKPVHGSHPTERKWCQILLLSFGLLCLIQATLNITLRLTSKSACSTTVLKTSPPTPGEAVTAVEEILQCNWLQQRVNALEEERNCLEAKNRELVDQLNNKNCQLNNQDCINRLGDLKNKNLDLNNQIYDLINRNNALNEQNNDFSNQIRNLNNQINELNKKNSELVDENRELSVQIGVLTNHQPVTVKPVCSVGWTEIRGRCYFLSGRSEQRSWDESRSHCQSMGADLVVINDEQEQLALYQMNGERYLLFWIGLYAVPGTFRWVDNTSLTISFWQEGQPGDGGPNNQENCVEMFHESPVRANWNDVNCRAPRRWLCEKEACH